MYLGSWKIDDYLTFPATVHDASGEGTTGTVTYYVYEDETTNDILTGGMAVLGDHVANLYSERIQLTAANGFEKGKSYTIAMELDLGGGAYASAVHTFQIEAEVDANSVSGVVAEVTTVSGNVDGSVASVTDPVNVGTFENDAITAAAIATAAVEKLADIIFRRHNEDVEASSNGDTVDLQSLYGAVAKLTNKAARSAQADGNLVTYKADRTTSLGTQTVESDSGNEPVGSVG